MAVPRTIPIFTALLLFMLCIQSADAERFRGKKLLVDSRVDTTDISPVNSRQTALPVLLKNQTFQLELYIEGARTNRTRGYTIAFDNTNNRFGNNFKIVKINGILPQEGLPQPTAISSGSDRSVIVPVNDYLATVTLRAIRDLTPGLSLRFDRIRTRVIDVLNAQVDTLNIDNAVVSFGRPDYNLLLDLDTSPGNQNLTETFGVRSDGEITVQIFGDRIKFMTGFIARFEFDTSQMAFDSFVPGSVLPNAQTLEPIITEVDKPVSEIEITAASFGSNAQVESGLLGTLIFKPTEGLSRTGVIMSGAEIRRGGIFRPFFTPLALEIVGLDADFDDNGFVDFRDFVLFAERFGSRRNDARYDERFDLLPDSIINFADFVLFTESFSFFRITVVD